MTKRTQILEHLDHDSATAKELSRLVNSNKTLVYGHLNRMIDEGLVGCVTMKNLGTHPSRVYHLRNNSVIAIKRKVAYRNEGV